MIDLASLFNSVSGQVVPVLINLTWQSSLLILSLWLLIKVFRIKQPRLRYYLWMFALIGTALTFPLSLAVNRIGIRRFNLNLMQTGVAAQRDKSSTRVKPISINRPSAATTVAQIGQPSEISHLSSTIGLVDWRVALPFSLWLCGVLIFTARFAAAHRRIIKIRRTSQPVGNRKVTAMLDELTCPPRGFWRKQVAQGHSSALLGHSGKKPVILCSEEISVPIVIGVLKPAIILPADFNEFFSMSELRSILAHELAHIDRCDYLMGLLQRLIQVIFFFHPLVWYACRQLNIECEHICDDSVIEVTDGCLDYAQALSKLVERFNGAPLILSPSPRALHSKTETYKRVERILDDNRGIAPSPKRIAILLSFGAVLLLAVSSSRVVIEGTERSGAIEQTGVKEHRLQSNVVSDSREETSDKFAFRTSAAYGKGENETRSSNNHTNSFGYASRNVKAARVKVIKERFTCCGRTSIRLIYVPAKSNPWDMEEFWRGGVDWQELFQ